MNADGLIVSNWLCVEGMMPETQDFLSEMLFKHWKNLFTGCFFTTQIISVTPTGICQFSTYVYSCSYSKENISFIIRNESEAVVKCVIYIYMLNLYIHKTDQKFIYIKTLKMTQNRKIAT